jgi:S-(hydroxymethyl)glutathione dehydrogenase/alcohol dehydrogenase
MKALLYRPGKGTPHLEDIEVDDPRTDEVLVSIEAAGVCHSDLQFMESREQEAGRGLYALYSAKLDHRLQPGIAERRQEEREADALVMGHEPAGTVVAVGAGVRSLAPGDRVMGIGMSHCGRCRQCLLGHAHLCTTLPRRRPDDAPRLSQDGLRITQFANVGAFAEQILVHETSLVKIGDDVPAGSAAILGCCVATGVGSALNTAEVRPGSSVVVFGAGGIGMSVLQGARIAGADLIVAVDPVAGKRALAEKLGATHTLDPADVDPVAAIAELTSGAGVDHAFETASTDSVAQQAYDCLGLRGCLTCLSATPPDVRTLVGAERRVQGGYLGSTRPQVDIPYYLDLYRQGRLFLDEMVATELDPAEFESVEDLLATSGAARVVLDFARRRRAA